MSPRRLGRHALMLIATLLITTAAGCITGERPSFSDDHTAPGAVTGDPAIDSVLELLDAGGDGQFVAEYDVLTKYDTISSTATVAQAAPDQRRIEIGDVEFTIRGGTTRTCRNEGARCVERLDDSFISDLQITHRFYADAAAVKLRQDATNRVGDAEAWTRSFDGREATCATVAVTGGEKRYCALDSGLLALRDGPEVLIELTSLSADLSGQGLDTD